MNLRNLSCSVMPRIRNSLVLIAVSGFAVAGLVMAPSAGAAVAPASAPAVAAVVPASVSAVAAAEAVNCAATPCYFHYFNQADGKCMGMPSSVGGTQAIQNTCNSNNTQFWKAIPTAFGFQLQNQGTGKCLVTKNNSPNPASAVLQRVCNAANRFQSWFLGGTGDTVFVFYNIGTAGHCGGVGECAIHPSGNSRASGAKLYVQTPGSNCTLVQSSCFYAWIRFGAGRG